MKGRLVAIAEAVAARLRADVATFVLPFEPERLPDYTQDLADCATLRVDVVGRKQRLDLLTRQGDSVVDYEIDVIIRKKPAGSVEQQPHLMRVELDRLSCLVEQISDHFAGIKLAGIDERFTGAETDLVTLGDHEHARLREAGIFLSIVTLTFRGTRRRATA
jgi:hypothetical protein